MEAITTLLLAARARGIAVELAGDGLVWRGSGAQAFAAGLTAEQRAGIERHLRAIADAFLPDPPRTGLSLQQNLTAPGLEKLNAGFSNIVVALHLSGALREDDVARALGSLMASQTALRTRYTLSGKLRGGIVAPAVAVPLETVRHDGPLEPERIAVVLEEQHDWCYADPDFTADTLMKARLLCFDGAAILLVVLAHFIADAFSETIVCNHLRAALNDRGRSGPPAAPREPSRYDTLVRRQGRQRMDLSLDAQAETLAARLAQVRPFALPPSCRGEGAAGIATVPLLALDRAQLGMLRTQAGLKVASEDFVVTALLTFALAIWSGQGRFILPSIYHGRGAPEDFDTIGLFMVPVAMAVDIDPQYSVRSNMARLFKGWVDTTRMGGVAAWQAMQRFPTDRTVLLNFAQDIAPDPGAAGSSRPGVRIAPLRMRPRVAGDLTGVGLYLLTMRGAEGIATTLFANRAMIGEAGIAALRQTVDSLFAGFLAGGADRPLATLAQQAARVPATGDA